ncbi:MAG TPA: hypothetical protein DEO84_07495 [candidate division Zixibacteria bacterium]|nr:hypothetical protein [candidate division Zixibacteria bacterium]
MKTIISILFLFFLTISGIAGPPEPPEAPESPNAVLVIPKIKLDTIRFGKTAREIDSSQSRLDNVLQRISDSIEVKDITIEGESIRIVLTNDSVISLSGNTIANLPHKDNSFVNVGHTYTVKQGDVVNGSIVNVGADVIVNGTVNGSVMTLGGNIYVAPTGYIRDGAVALSGKLKVEPGGQVTNIRLSLNDSRREIEESSTNIYRVMAIVFLVIYIVWMILAATFASFMKVNVERVANLIGARPLKNFFMGYLFYLLGLAAIIVLTISILGIPLAIVGVPVAVFAGMVLAVTALSSLIGQRLTRNREVNFKTFFIGSLVLSGLPGLFFLIQLISGSLVIMIFSWIMIGLLIFVIAPFGLGAVLTTRFGSRTGPTVPPPPPGSAAPIAHGIAPQAPST